jgi:hypothetical protein
MKNKLAFLALFLAVLAMPVAFAAESDSQIVLTNVAPTVGVITATDPVTLSSSGTVTVWCNATITDTNGYADISSASAKLWVTGHAEGDADDFNNHYTQATCTLSTGSGDTKDASCSFDVKYSAESGEWICKIIALDVAAAPGNAQATDVTVNALKGLTIGTTIVFDSTALDTVSAEETLTVTNKGNAVLDVSLYTYGASDHDQYAFACTTGNIAYTAIKYNLTAAQDWDTSMTTIGDQLSAPVSETAFNLAIDSNATASTGNIYWKVHTPATGVGGTCNGHLGVLVV